MYARLNSDVHSFGFQKSARSTGISNLTWSIRLVSGTSPYKPPKTTHPSGVRLATRCPACLLSPVCMWAWSIPINRLNLSFSSTKRLVFKSQKISNLRNPDSSNFFTDTGYPDSFYGVSPTVIQRFNWYALHLGLHGFLLTAHLCYGHRSIFPFEPKRQRSVVPN